MKNWMKTALLGLFATTSLLAATTPEDQAVIDAQKKAYPLSTCVVSKEKLEVTSMGAPIDYLYKTKDKDGKETVRLVRFCCKSCVKDFNKDPDKFLKQLDAAAVKGAK